MPNEKDNFIIRLICLNLINSVLSVPILTVSDQIGVRIMYDKYGLFFVGAKLQKRHKHIKVYICLYILVYQVLKILSIRVLELFVIFIVREKLFSFIFLILFGIINGIM